MKYFVLAIMISMVGCSDNKGSFDDIKSCVQEGKTFIERGDRLKSCAEKFGWKYEEYLAEGLAMAIEDQQRKIK